jgi:hypothetical protein
MMEATPSPPFKVIEAEFPLHFLVVALDPPPKLREVYESLHRRICGQI